ncbi:hypothetical protein ACFVYP_34095 [Kitasatospora sp. NPDC058201]|uniref:hypothetical protein n=1 Tax=unclassified Kitasatospora TaxID=2633591 RepID=UPI00365ABFE9
MTSRRSALITVATVLALSAVAACNDGDAQSAPTAAGAPATPSGTTSSAPTGTASSAATADTPTVAPTPAATAMPSPAGAPVDAAGAFDPAVALANADRAPYAATETMKTTATAGGQVGSVLTGTGRVNYNTPTREGRTESKMTLGGDDEPMLWMDTVSTGTMIFTRDRTKPGSTWSAEDVVNEARGDDFNAYVKALVDAGPAARKGMEQKNGVPAYHLGAGLTAAQIKAIDPKEYQKMLDKGVDGKQFDVWIDRAGRVLAQTQSMKMTTGGKTVTSTITLTYTDFGPRETFTAPTATAS